MQNSQKSKIDPEKFKKLLETFNDMDPFEQGRFAYKHDIPCPHPKGSLEAEEWRRGEVSASLGDSYD